MTRHLHKLASVGAVFAAAACPICFPKLALLGGLIGLGAFSAYEAQLLIAAQLLVIVALASHAVAYRQERRRWVFGGALVSGAAVFAGLYAFGSEWLTYTGFVGLVAASSLDLWARLRRRPIAAQ
jgi:mercuric ion transport protein